MASLLSFVSRVRPPRNLLKSSGKNQRVHHLAKACYLQGRLV